MVNREKIEEWIKEVEERPSSAPVILQYIASRLQDLTRRNEELLAEVIALQSGTRIEEYEKRIAHLEYQLELLKRQVGGGLSANATIDTIVEAQPEQISQYSILVYDANGRILRVMTAFGDTSDGRQLAMITGEPDQKTEPPRILVVSENEELMLVFSSGRIATVPVRDIPPVRRTPTGTTSSGILTCNWVAAPVVVEPHGGEALTCIAKISQLALADCFIQASRRGYLKRIQIRMADSILHNRFIGAGIKKPPDRNFEVLICQDDQQIGLLTMEGNLTILDVKSIPFSIEEGLRLSETDHLAAAFVVPRDQSLLLMTNIGKLVHISDERLTASEPSKRRGQAVFSAQRRAQGVRAIGVVPALPGGWMVTLARTGELFLKSVERLSGEGTLDKGIEPVAIDLIPASMGGR